MLAPTVERARHACLARDGVLVRRHAQQLFRPLSIVLYGRGVRSVKCTFGKLISAVLFEDDDSHDYVEVKTAAKKPMPMTEHQKERIGCGCWLGIQLYRFRSAKAGAH